jgi:hypothetical protein
MVYKVNVAVCSEIRTKHSTQSEHHLELLNVNPLNDELNPICYLLALLGAQHFLHVSRIRVKSLNLKLLMSYIYDISNLRVKPGGT